MILREYKESDLADIERIHRSNDFGYTLPDFSSPSIIAKHVVEDEGAFVMAGFLELSAQVFLFCEGGWRNPAWRLEALRKIHRAGEADARRLNIKELNAFLPPAVAKQFGGRLYRMGWRRYAGDDWKCFSYEVG